MLGNVALFLSMANLKWTTFTVWRLSVPSRRDCAALAWRPATRFGTHDSPRVGTRSRGVAKYLTFSHFPFRVQRAEKFCSTPPNRRSAPHRRNTSMEELPRLSSVTEELSSVIQPCFQILNIYAWQCGFMLIHG